MGTPAPGREAAALRAGLGLTSPAPRQPLSRLWPPAPPRPCPETARSRCCHHRLLTHRSRWLKWATIPSPAGPEPSSDQASSGQQAIHLAVFSPRAA